jgi:hypothetical protein
LLDEDKTMQRLLTLVALTALTAGCSKPADGGAAAQPASKAASAAPASAAPASAAPASAAPSEAPAAAAAGPEDAEAATLFAQRCASCHGAEGKGDGAAAQALNPKPRTFTDAEWQKSVSDEHLTKVIVEGGMAVGKSPLMPPNPDLASEEKKPVVAALVKLVRRLGAP